MELLPQDAPPYKLFGQAKTLLKKTSRGKNADWYKEANDLDLQWHLWIGTQSFSSAIYNKKDDSWSSGPSLPSISFELDDEHTPIGLDEASSTALHALLQEIITETEVSFTPKSLGVLFHLADSFRVRDLDPEFAQESEFEDLNELLQSAPDIALGDETITASDGNWQILPLLGKQPDEDRLSMATQVSSKYRILVDEFREYGIANDFPIIVNVFAAPIESLAAIPELFPDHPTEDSFLLFQFESFTSLVALGSRGEMQLIRPVLHQGKTQLEAAELSDLISKTSALLNIKSPKLFYVSMTGIDQGEIQTVVNPLLESGQCQEVLSSSSHASDLVASIPGHRLEFLVASKSATPPESSDTIFANLREQWAFRDFYGASAEELEMMPSWLDFQILRYSRIAQKIAIAAVIALAAWVGTDFFFKQSSEAWKVSDGDTQSATQSVAQLTKEKKEWKHWSNIFSKRSEGWIAMETIASLVPEDSGIIIQRADYEIKADPGDSDDMVGITREWSISGFANPSVAANISLLGSKEKVTDLLNQLAEDTQSPYLAVDNETRELRATFSQRMGRLSPRAQQRVKTPENYTSAFDLTIKQSATEEDSLALTTDSFE